MRGVVLITNAGDLLLASGSQDKSIRLWKISNIAHDSVLASANANAKAKDEKERDSKGMATTSFSDFAHIVRYFCVFMCVCLSLCRCV